MTSISYHILGNMRILFILALLLMVSWSSSAIYVPQTEGTPPEIVINFAGNLGDRGGPFWRPPGESFPLTGVFSDGYYTNDSRQQEDFIYINITVKDTESPIAEVWLHWLNGTTWTNTSYQFTHSKGFNWEFNSSGQIATAEGYNYSFDVFARDTQGDTTTVQWIKTGLSPAEMQCPTRRYIQLGCMPISIDYMPFYFYNATYLSGQSWTGGDKRDQLHHDQGQDGSLNDTGYLLAGIPTDAISLRFCTLFVGFWFDESVCVQPTTIDTIYYHFWWKTAENSIGAGYARHRQELTGNVNQTYVASHASSAAQQPISPSFPPAVGTYYLESSMLQLDEPQRVGDNTVYELALFFGSGTNPHSSPLPSMDGCPNVISNRSYTSFALVNVPDNATLNASYYDSDSDGLSDWTELYQIYTNPFLADTDADGATDYEETHGAENGYSNSDPNIYTDTTEYRTTGTPFTPAKPSGPVSGKKGVEYTYSGVTTDPNGGDVAYLFDWGDGTYSEWTAFVPSGTAGSALHIWTEEGAFEIRVKAKNINSSESEWSDPLPITMPVSHQTTSHPILALLQRTWMHHPLIWWLLTQIESRK
jgi:hypothetical protein